MNVYMYKHSYEQQYQSIKVDLFRKEPGLGCICGYSQKWFYAMQLI